ncbi:unnamed protein product, partial [Mesorhabditis spiculigera]
MCRLFLSLLTILSSIICFLAAIFWVVIPYSVTVTNEMEVCPRYRFLQNRGCFEYSECARVNEGRWTEDNDLIKFFACNPSKSQQMVTASLLIFGGYLIVQLSYDLACFLHALCKWISTTVRRNQNKYIV